MNLHALRSFHCFPTHLSPTPGSYTVLRGSWNRAVATGTQLPPHMHHASSPRYGNDSLFVCLLTVTMLAELRGTNSTVFNLQVAYISARCQVHSAATQDHKSVRLLPCILFNWLTMSAEQSSVWLGGDLFPNSIGTEWYEILIVFVFLASFSCSPHIHYIFSCCCLLLLWLIYFLKIILVVIPLGHCDTSRKVAHSRPN
jgi:hypothetical protein